MLTLHNADVAQLQIASATLVAAPNQCLAAWPRLTHFHAKHYIQALMK